MKAAAWLYYLFVFLLFSTVNAHAGNSTYLLELVSTGKASIDRELTRHSVVVLQHRLQSLGEAEAVVEQHGNNRISLSLARSGDEATGIVTQIIRPSRLELRLVLENVPAKRSAKDTETLQEFSLNAETGQLESHAYLVRKKPLLAGDLLTEAQAAVDEVTGRPLIRLNFNDHGKTLLAQATAAHIGRQLAVVVDGKVISVARIQTAISWGQLQITGGFDQTAAQDIALALESNSLPATLRIASYRETGSTPHVATSHNRPATTRVDVDQQIPIGQRAGSDDIAVVIGNAHYRTNGTPPVDYALQDAQTMRQYLISAFGYDPANIIYLEDASLAAMSEVFGTSEDYRGKLFKWVKPGKSRIFIYYVGHGAPDQESGEGYFVPVDANPQYIRTSGYKLSTFYDNLARIPALKKTVLIDACFSGSSANGQLLKGISGLTARLKAEPKAARASDILFTSAGMNQVASWYPQKRHSLFSYFFFKGIQGAADSNRDGSITVGEMKAYLNEQVPYMARRLTGNEQQPFMQGNDADPLVRLRR